MNPPRTLKGMVFAILTLVLVAFAMAGLLGQCSFSPLGPSIERSAAPAVDLEIELSRAARQVDFPVVHPQVHAGWQANSAGVVSQGLQAVRVGWLTGNHYLRLSQSNAPEEELVAFETEQPPQAVRTVQAAGQQWVVYRSVRSEQAWVGGRDGVRLLITGNGTETEFRALAEAVVAAPPVPRR